MRSLERINNILRDLYIEEEIKFRAYLYKSKRIDRKCKLYLSILKHRLEAREGEHGLSRRIKYSRSSNRTIIRIG